VKVLLVHNRYRNPGGEERHVDLLEASLTDIGVEVARLEVDSGTLRTARSRLLAGSLVAYNPASATLVRNAVRRTRADIAHFHNLWPILSAAALRGAREAGARVVLTAHNYRFACPTGILVRRGKPHDDCVTGSPFACSVRALPDHGAQGLLYGAALSVQRRLRLLDRWVDAFVAPTDFVAHVLGASGFPAERTRVIRHGVPGDPRRSVTAPPASRGSHALYAGRLSTEKGVRVLLEAARIAPEVPLVIAGSGPLKNALIRELPSSVTLVGHLDQNALSSLRASARMAVMPSTWFEVCGYTALEAAAAGRAVVASNIGGIPEVVVDGETGLLVQPGDPAALAEAMRRLWHDRELATRLGEQAADRAHRRHDLERAAREHLSLYAEVGSR
jgi:glycosyltransferase involved in cell wall biosynthesis